MDLHGAGISDFSVYEETLADGRVVVKLTVIDPPILYHLWSPHVEGMGYCRLDIGYILVGREYDNLGGKTPVFFLLSTGLRFQRIRDTIATVIDG